VSRVKFDVRYTGLLSMGYEAKDISNKDLDDMMYSGVFFGYSILNAPDSNYVQIIVTRHNENWIVQEAKDYLDKIYLRSYKDGYWGGWTELVISRDENEPEKEFIIVERPHSHALATPQTAGFMSPEDKIKLDALTTEREEQSNEALVKKVKELNAKVEKLDILKADKEHNHDDVYIPAFSSARPSNQNKVGQIWIEINKEE